MQTQGSGQGPWPGNGWRNNQGIILLLVGVVIGALVVGLSGGIWSGFFGNNRGGVVAGEPRFRSQEPSFEPPVQAQPVVPQPGFRGGGIGDARHGIIRESRGHGFWPFDGLRWIVPLLLIGGGAWLLSRRQQGPGNWSGPSGTPGNPAGSQSIPVTEPRPTDPETPPSTGETRML